MSDDLFRDPTPAEAQMAVLQFMGQHLTGELKELERNLVSRNNTLNGMTLRPEAVMQSVAQVTGPVTPQPVAPSPVNVLQPVAAVPTPTVIQPVEQQLDPNQLELNFNSSPYTERVFDKLELLERKIASIIDVQQQILDILQSEDNAKKKDQ